MASEKTLYRRTLPGGGYVNVDVEAPSASGVHRAYVAVARALLKWKSDGKARF